MRNRGKRCLSYLDVISSLRSTYSRVGEEVEETVSRLTSLPAETVKI
jgi:hypothetical protein